VRNSRKEWVITGGASEVYPFGDEEFITEAELNKAIKDRELYLAGVKARNDEYQNSKKAAAAPTPAAGKSAATNEEFKF